MSTIGCPYPSLKSLQNQASTSRVSSKVSKFWKRSRNWRWKKVKVKKRHTWQVILSSSTWWFIWFWWNLMKNSVHISSLNYTVHWPNELASPRFNAGPKIGTQRVQGIIPPVISSVACRNIIHPVHAVKSTSPRLLDAEISTPVTSPLLCGWANSRRRGTCSPQSLGTLRRQPKNPAMAILRADKGATVPLPRAQKKGTKGRYLLRHLNDTKAHVDLGSQIPFPRAVHEDPQNGRAVDSVPGQCRCNSIGSPMWCGSWCPHQPSTSKCLVFASTSCKKHKLPVFKSPLFWLLFDAGF